MVSNPCDWQVSCKKLNQRGRHLLQSGQWADCSFLVGSEPNQSVEKGHKLILAMASPVFEAMFFGKMAETTEPIPIVDVRPEAFKALLEYVYTDNININSFDKACEMCYSAKKYMLPHLVEECTRFMWSDLSPKNACRAYEFAKLFEEPNLMDKCLQIIRNQTMEVLSETSFNDVDISTIITVFDQPYLNIHSELVLFEAAEKYMKVQGSSSPAPQQFALAQVTAPSPQVDNEESGTTESQPSTVEGEHSMSETSQQETETPPNNVSTISTPGPSNSSPASSSPTIRNAVQKIRFLTLTPQQFAEGPSNSTLLSQSEAFAILMNISSPSCGKSMPEGFSTSKEHRKNSFIRPASFVMESPTSPISSSDCAPLTVPPPAIPFASQREQGDALMVDHHQSPHMMNFRDRYCCHRSVLVHQTDKLNTSILDCSVTFTVDRSICVIGIQVPTQGYLENPLHIPVSDTYSELLYAHLLDADGSRLTYTHCTSRVAYRSLLEITFNRPFYIQKNKVYKIGVVFNKAGLYPIGICCQTVVCDSVFFSFGVGPSSDSVRDGLIRSIIFTY